MRILFAGLLSLLAACPICPDGRIDVVAGRRDGTVHGGDVLQLRAQYGDETFGGPSDCLATWFVNDVAGGSAEVGTIDACGEYRAPEVLPPNLAVVHIVAMGWDPIDGDCADCCASAFHILEPVP